MAKSLSQLKSTKSTNPPIIGIYGVDGVGKTSLAAEFPSPIYLQTEGERPPSDVELMSPGVISSFDEALDVIGELITEEHDRKTLILDSLDGLEPLVHAKTCARIGATSIDANDKGSPAAFGRGYTEADTEWRELMDAFAALTQRGVAVVWLAHPAIIRFDSPVTDPYSRYEIKLNKRASALVRERSDIVAFMNYRISLKEKEVGFKKSVTHGEGGGDRQILLEERPGFVAKNRFKMPPQIPYKAGAGYEALQKFFPAPTGIAA